MSQLFVNCLTCWFLTWWKQWGCWGVEIGWAHTRGRNFYTRLHMTDPEDPSAPSENSLAATLGQSYCKNSANEKKTVKWRTSTFWHFCWLLITVSFCLFVFFSFRCGPQRHGLYSEQHGSEWYRSPSLKMYLITILLLQNAPPHCETLRDRVVFNLPRTMFIWSNYGSVLSMQSMKETLTLD